MLRTVKGCALSLIAIAILLDASPLSAQRLGQWSWSGSLYHGQSDYDNSVAGHDTSQYGLQQLRLRLDMRGYIMHPLIGNFSLGVDTQYSTSTNFAAIDTDSLGLRGDVELFPLGRVTARFRFQHREFSYQEPESADPDDPPLIPQLFGLPGSGTSWGGEVVLRRGFLRGFNARFEGTALDFIDPEQGNRTDGRQVLSWNRSSERLRHAISLERRDRSFSRFDFGQEDLLLNIAEYGPIAPSWNWSMRGHGTMRTLSFNETETQFEVFQLRNLLTRNPNPDRELQISQQSTLLSSEAGDILNHTLSSRYRWGFDNGWQVLPLVSVNAQEAPGTSTTAPQVGVNLTWGRTRGSVNLVGLGSIAWGEVSGTRQGVPVSESVTTLNVGSSIALGSVESLRAELSTNYSQNDLTRDLLPDDLPDLGTSLAYGGTEDRLELHLTLRRKIREVRLRLESQWQNRQIAPDFVNVKGEIEQMTLRLNISSRRIYASVNVTDSEILNDAGFQTALSQSASFHYRPFPILSFSATYRLSERDFNLVPRIDSDYYSLNANLHLAGFTLNGQVYEAVESSVMGLERTNRGVSWSISRGFGGLLPIVTAPQRRGVIR